MPGKVWVQLKAQFVFKHHGTSPVAIQPIAPVPPCKPAAGVYGLAIPSGDLAACTHAKWPALQRIGPAGFATPDLHHSGFVGRVLGCSSPHWAPLCCLFVNSSAGVDEGESSGAGWDRLNQRFPELGADKGARNCHISSAAAKSRHKQMSGSRPASCHVFRPPPCRAEGS